VLRLYKVRTYATGTGDRYFLVHVYCYGLTQLIQSDRYLAVPLYFLKEFQ
jgi:hypothetical protein